MDLRFSLLLSGLWVLVTGILLIINLVIGYSSAQLLTSKPPPSKDIFRISIILFGVDDETGNVFSFVKVNNVTAAKFFNASKEDSIDHDGVVEIVLNFPNETVDTGANFTACNVVLKDQILSCKWGLNMPGRTDAVQIVLPTFKQRVS